MKNRFRNSFKIVAMSLLMLVPLSSDSVLAADACNFWGNLQGYMSHHVPHNYNDGTCSGYRRHGNYGGVPYAGSLTNTGLPNCPNTTLVGILGYNGNYRHFIGSASGYGWFIQLTVTVPGYVILASSHRHPIHADCVTFDAI